MSHDQPRREQSDKQETITMTSTSEIKADNGGTHSEVLASFIKSAGNEVVGKSNSPKVVHSQSSGASERGCITIGEALEATALTAGNKPVDYSDAAAIQAAEVRATGRTNIIPGGVAATAQSAATRNARASNDEEKTKLGQVLAEASSKLPSDKPVTRRDAEGVIGAELRNDPNLCTHPGGVAASLAAAARLNQSCNNPNS